MREIKLRVVDWWEKDNEENFYKNPFVKLLSKNYKPIYSHNPDFVICSCFGWEALKYPCARIFYTGENLRTDWNVMDYGIDFDTMDFGDRHLHYPLWAMYWDKNAVLNKHIVSDEDLAMKNKFASFMATNAAPSFASMRDSFFDALCAYKRVDSGGRHKNNLGFIVGDRYGDYWASKHEWLKGYKFNIAFENSSYPGYLTEKLFDAFAARCVPIYWGDTSLKDNGGGESRWYKPQSVYQCA